VRERQGKDGEEEAAAAENRAQDQSCKKDCRRHVSQQRRARFGKSANPH